MGDNPQVDAQFCSAYGVAVGLLRGKAGLAEFTDAQIREDSEVAELATQVKILPEISDPPQVTRIEDDFPVHVDKPHVLIVKTRDGRELRKTYTIRYILSPQRMSLADTAEKFCECTRFSGICPDDKARQIIAAVKDLENCRQISDFTALCKLK
jgi:2-methylcitrate dehydratase PrpD